jgi:hypothetical protein
MPERIGKPVTVGEALHDADAGLVRCRDCGRLVECPGWIARLVRKWNKKLAGRGARPIGKREVIGCGCERRRR